MKIYLAGPMRGIELFNFPAFMQAAMALREQGHVVINPAERDMAIGFNPAEPMDSPANLKVFSLGEAFEWDFRQIRTSDAIVLLTNWRSSKGVQAELVLAMAMQKEIYYWQESKEELVATVLSSYTIVFDNGIETLKAKVLEHLDVDKDDSFENIM